MEDRSESGDRDRPPRCLDAKTHRIFWEVRHARLRLALAENDLAWAQQLLVAGEIAPEQVLIILHETMDELCGGLP